MPSRVAVGVQGLAGYAHTYVRVRMSVGVHWCDRDLGGQQKFRGMWERYCRGVQAIMYAVHELSVVLQNTDDSRIFKHFGS